MRFANRSKVVLLSVSLLTVIEMVAADPLPRSFRHGDYLSAPKRKILTHSAYKGDSAAALTLADYYALVDKKPRLRERFLQLGAQSGSTEAYDALIAFYVQPGGIFRPREALALRRKRARRFVRAPRPDDKTWAYNCSLEFKYSADSQDLYRRLELLRLAEALGSRKAGKEISGYAQERRNRVRVSTSNLKDVIILKDNAKK